MTERKIGTTELLQVRSSGRRRYLNLSKVLCDSFDLETGDILRVEIKSVVKREEKA